MKRIPIPGPGQTVVIAARGRNNDIRRGLEYYVKEAQRQTARVAPTFKGRTVKDTCRNIFNYVLNNVTYIEDGDQYQDIRLPRRLFDSGRGDCKSMALFICGCLKNLGLQPVLTYVSFERGNRTPSHVYVTCQGIIIDPVTKKFDYEPQGIKYRYRKNV